MGNHGARIAELLRAQAEIGLQLAAEFEALEAEQKPGLASGKHWVTLKEFAERSGLGDSTIRKHIQAGMPHKKYGPRALRINVDAAEEWLERQGLQHRKRSAA